MTFTSYSFLFFFAALLLIRCGVRNAGADKRLLLVASIAFYLTWDVPCVLVVLFTSMMDFTTGRRMGRTEDSGARRRLLMMSLFANLGLLAFFKYNNFILGNIRALANLCGAHLAPLHWNVVVPPGISYFTFGSLSYVLGVYYGRVEPCESARDYSLFVTFFPKILSGPIVRGADFLPQLKQRALANWEEIESGTAQFLMGAVKKMVVADQLAGNVNQIFSDPGRFDSLTLLQGILGFTVQLYCDFSGYSDMAIGVARVLGFQFPENFQMPFSSVNITEYWRRWHITMSTWFRDYLFLPLELARRDNPSPLLRASSNMMITMLVVGLWHGPSWNYVIYGGIHGAALSIHKIWTTLKPSSSWMQSRGAQVLGMLVSRCLTLSVAVFSLVFFRTATLGDALGYFNKMLAVGHPGERLLSIYIFPTIAIMLLIHLLVQKDRNLALELPRNSIGMRIAAYAGLLLILVSLAATEGTPFIYFKY